MNKIKIFYGQWFRTLENDVNAFALRHKIINTDICTEKRGNDIYYTIIVLYCENKGE